jgi:hypothetical protein
MTGEYPILTGEEIAGAGVRRETGITISRPFTKANGDVGVTSTFQMDKQIAEAKYWPCVDLEKRLREIAADLHCDYDNAILCKNSMDDGCCAHGSYKELLKMADACRGNEK